MKVVTCSDVPVLIPNEQHKNFTESDVIIPKGTTLTGEFKAIKGLRKSQPFTYRLFYTNKDQIIYTKNIKPITMERTEVTLSAEGGEKPSAIINIPKNYFDKNAMYGAILGAAAGFGFAHYKQKSVKQKLLFTCLGAVAGIVAVKVIVKAKAITVKK
jgi:hypothetical protein